MVISESTISYMSPQYLFPVCLFTFHTEFTLPFYCPVLQSWKILHLFVSLLLSWWNFVSSPPLILFLPSENMMIATTCNRQPCKTLTFLLAFIPIFYWLFIHDNLSYPLPAFVKSPLKFKSALLINSFLRVFVVPSKEAKRLIKLNFKAVMMILLK